MGSGVDKLFFLSLIKIGSILPFGDVKNGKVALAILNVK